MRLVLVLLVSIFSLGPALADDASRQQLARQFVEETRGSGLPQAIIDAIWKPYEAQLRTYNPTIGDDVLADVKKVLTDSFATLAGQIDDKYAELYARDLSEDQLTQLIAFFKTPLGRAYMDTNASVDGEMGPEVQKTMTSLMAQVLQKLNDAARQHGLKLGA